MQINLKIRTPSDVYDERTKTVQESIDLMRRQAKSNMKYAQKMGVLMRKLMRLEEELRGEK